MRRARSTSVSRPPWTGRRTRGGRNRRRAGAAVAAKTAGRPQPHAQAQLRAGGALADCQNVAVPSEFNQPSKFATVGAVSAGVAALCGTRGRPSSPCMVQPVPVAHGSARRRRGRRPGQRTNKLPISGDLMAQRIRVQQKQQQMQKQQQKQPGSRRRAARQRWLRAQRARRRAARQPLYPPPAPLHTNEDFCARAERARAELGAVVWRPEWLPAAQAPEQQLEQLEQQQRTLEQQQQQLMMMTEDWQQPLTPATASCCSSDPLASPFATTAVGTSMQQHVAGLDGSYSVCAVEEVCTWDPVMREACSVLPAAGAMHQHARPAQLQQRLHDGCGHLSSSQDDECMSGPAGADDAQSQWSC